MKHIPSPWIVGDGFDKHEKRIRTMNGHTIAIVRENDLLGDDRRQTCKTNSRLIAAAPDLLEAILPLVEVAEFIQLTVTMPSQRKQAFDETVAKARAAIAKAEGKDAS